MNEISEIASSNANTYKIKRFGGVDRAHYTGGIRQADDNINETVNPHLSAFSADRNNSAVTTGIVGCPSDVVEDEWGALLCSITLCSRSNGNAVLLAVNCCTYLSIPSIPLRD